LLRDPAERHPVRNITAPASNVLDETINSTNRSRDACMVVVNIYARTTLRFDLAVDGECTGKPVRIDLVSDSDAVATVTQSAVRAVSPRVDLRALLSGGSCPEEESPENDRENDPENDATLLLARIESKEPDKFAPIDQAGALVSHHGGGWHFHLERTDVPGAYHFGVMISGTYTPSAPARDDPAQAHLHEGAVHDQHAPSPMDSGRQDGTRQRRAEYFSRILTVSTGLSDAT